MKEIIDLAEQKLSEIVLADARSIAVFQQFGIDFCCGGKRSLAHACKQKAIAVETVVAEILKATAIPQAASEGIDAAAFPLDILADHIVATHHAYVQAQTPEILRLLDKVSKRHGPEHPELHEINSIFQAVAGELAMHMRKEELILFPAIKRLAAVERGEAAYQTPPFGTVANPIHMMEMEHESAGGGLDQIRSLTSDFKLPEGACMSYWQVYQLLDAFEKDLHVHVHLENNILFPKAIQLESEILKTFAI